MENDRPEPVLAPLRSAVNFGEPRQSARLQGRRRAFGGSVASSVARDLDRYDSDAAVSDESHRVLGSRGDPLEAGGGWN